MHAWDALTPLEETLRFLDDAVRNGKIAYYGFSNYPRLAASTKAVWLAKANGYAPPVTLQPQYNLLVRDIEHEIVPACLDAGIGLLPWSPLGGGWLSGQVQARPDADRRHPPGREPASAAWRPMMPRNAKSDHLGGDRRGRGHRQGARGQHGAGGAGLGRGAAGGHLGDPRRPHAGSSWPTISARRRWL